MRMIGTCARGIRIPIISSGDNLGKIVVDSVIEAVNGEIRDRDVIGITESVVAKSQGNYASYEDIAEEIREKFPEGEVGVVFPILSRNRFLNILKGISAGAKKVYVLLSYPQDEVGNPIVDMADFDMDDIENKLYNEQEFRKINNSFAHPFTDIDYISLYKKAGENIEMYFSADAKDILKLTKNVLICGVHNRFALKKKVLKAGASSVYTLCDILSKPKQGRGHNEKYGVLGSNISTADTIKLFPNDCTDLINFVRDEIKRITGKNIEVLVYGDGAFKDPAHGIWELADPVVSPAFTEGLYGQPNEVKLKYVADNNFAQLRDNEKRQAVSDFIKNKSNEEVQINEGTTSRIFADLLGSLCDLISGSGDKGTPVVLIQGYFDNYSDA